MTLVNDGTFYFPPRFANATLAEFRDFWLNVPVPDDALARFCAAHVAIRAEVFEENRNDLDLAGWPEQIPVQWARDYARLAAAAMFAPSAPRDTHDRFWQLQVDVDYSRSGDTVLGVFKRYRFGWTCYALRHPEMPDNPHSGRLTDQLDQVVNLLDRIDDGVADVDKTLFSIKDSVEDLG